MLAVIVRNHTHNTNDFDNILILKANFIMADQNNDNQQQGQQNQQQQNIQTDRQRVVVDTNQYEKRSLETTKTKKR